MVSIPFSRISVSYTHLDLDGTILDSMSAWDHVGENYLRSQGIEPEPDLDEAIATMSLHQAADYFIEHYGVKQTRDELLSLIHIW